MTKKQLLNMDKKTELINTKSFVSFLKVQTRKFCRFIEPSKNYFVAHSPQL